MAINFIGPLLLFTLLISLAGTLYGLFKKDKPITKLSFTVLVMVVVIYIILEGFLME